MKQLFFIILTALLLPLSSFCQGDPYNSGYGLQNGMGLPKEYSDKYSDEIQQNVDFISYSYVSSNIDIRDFKSRFPNLTAPDFIEILPPVFSNNTDIIVLISLMINSKPTEKDIVIWLASNASTSNISFFTDNNLDRNYNNDGLPFKIKPGQKPVKVIMGDVENGAIPQDFWIAVPRAPKQKPTRLTNRPGLNQQFSVGILAGVGFGSLNYEFDNLITGYPAWYDVEHTEKYLGLSFSYSFNRFRLGISSTYQSQNFYTSYYNLRKGETYYETDPNGIRRLFVNVETNRNIDKHPGAKIQLAVEGLARIYLSRSTELQPIISTGIVSFLPGEYVADSRFDQTIYKLENTKFFEGGLRVEFKTKNDRSVFLGFTANKLLWNPTNFREETPHENLKINYISFRFTSGYNFGL